MTRFSKRVLGLERPEATIRVVDESPYSLDLRELLREPIVQLLMKRDGVTTADMEELFGNLESDGRNRARRPVLRLSGRAGMFPDDQYRLPSAPVSLERGDR